MGGGKYGGKGGDGYGGGGKYGGSSYGLGGEMEEMDSSTPSLNAFCYVADAGENLSKICRTDPDDSDLPGDNDDPALRKVIIQGTKEQIARCKEAINGVLMGEEPKDVLAQLDGAVLIKMLR
eukprot:g16201.t1